MTSREFPNDDIIRVAISMTSLEFLSMTSPEFPINDITGIPYRCFDFLGLKSSQGMIRLSMRTWKTCQPRWKKKHLLWIFLRLYSEQLLVALRICSPAPGLTKNSIVSEICAFKMIMLIIQKMSDLMFYICWPWCISKGYCLSAGRLSAFSTFWSGES